MNSREILEAFRKGNINEKTIAKFLFLLSERCDTLEQNQKTLARLMEKLQNLMGAQLRIQDGLKKNYETIGKTLGLDPKALSGINSEQMETRPHSPELGGE